MAVQAASKRELDEATSLGLASQAAGVLELAEGFRATEAEGGIYLMEWEKRTLTERLGNVRDRVREALTWLATGDDGQVEMVLGSVGTLKC